MYYLIEEGSGVGDMESWVRAEAAGGGLASDDGTEGSGKFVELVWKVKLLRQFFSFNEYRSTVQKQQQIREQLRVSGQHSIRGSPWVEAFQESRKQ